MKNQATTAKQCRTAAYLVFGIPIVFGIEAYFGNGFGAITAVSVFAAVLLNTLFNALAEILERLAEIEKR